MSGAGIHGHPVVAAPHKSRFLATPQGVALWEPAGGSPGVTFPAGFLAGGVAAGIKDSGRPDVGVLAVAPEWRSRTTSAAVFTRNAFAAAPVVVSKTDCDLAHLNAVVMNSGNANACTGAQGVTVAQAMQAACAETLGVPSALAAVCSTGIIGVQLDPASTVAGVKKAAGSLLREGGPDFSLSILTTDRFPKACAYEIETGTGQFRLGACAKGAGMIAPAMATMLCAATTDAVLSPAEMESLLAAATERSFNRITVDGQMSTNDSVIFLASGASGVHPEGDDLSLIGDALDAALLRLALMIVADGEGATKVVRIAVLGADEASDARSVARAVADSPLVKTAMHGCDPNWGRIISSAGAAMAGRSLPDVSLRLCELEVVKGGEACAISDTSAAALTEAMKDREIDIVLDLGLGSHCAELFFADMGHDYITINAEYHS